MNTYKGANRYGLVLETINNKKYYYDVNKRRFIEFCDDEKISKCSLQALDFLTASFNNINDFAKLHNIEDEIRVGYITYNHEGKRYLHLCFNNKAWAHVALSYKGKKVDFNDKSNLEAFNDVYCELINPNSRFADMILKNEKKTINVYPKTLETIEAIVRHEKISRRQEAIRDKSSYEREQSARKVYDQDKTGFYLDLRDKLTKYRDFRTIYLNYCRYIEKKNEIIDNYNRREFKERVKKLEQPLTLFDPNDRGLYGK